MVSLCSQQQVGGSSIGVGPGVSRSSIIRSGTGKHGISDTGTVKVEAAGEALYSILTVLLEETESILVPTLTQLSQYLWRCL